MNEKDNKNKVKFINLLSIFLFFFFINLNFISAQPTTIVETFEEGLTIVESQHETLKQNENYQYNFFVYNKSNGITMTSAEINNCSFYLANSNGEVILYNESVYYSPSNYWLININQNNLSEIGTYFYGVTCNTDIVGGSLSGGFDVSPSGKGGNDNLVFFIFVILLLYGITFIGFFGKNIPITILGGMAMLFLGVYIVNYGIIIYRDDLTNYIAYLTMGIGIVTAFWAILEQLDLM